ncbi:MAG: cytochrome c family protein [Hyphomonas sp.]|nr:cytochrome c family protein [Hyphomonas sp.]
MVALGLALAACGGPKQTAPAPSTPAAEPAATPAAEPAAEPAAAPEAAAPETAATETPAAEPAAEPAAAPAATDAASAFAGLPAPYDTADYNRGKRTFKLCQSCHLVAEGAGNLVGPNLHGVINRAAGSVEGFTYSPAMTASGKVWTPDELETYLENPAAEVPGTAMSFAGVRNPEDRKAVIAYLMVESGYKPE